MDYNDEWRKPAGDWISALGSNKPLPAGGALALVTLAGAAALTAKVARTAGLPASEFIEFSGAFQRFADEDCRLYVDASTADPSKLRTAAETSLHHLETAHSFPEAAGQLTNKVGQALQGDLEAAIWLSMTASIVLANNLKENLALWGMRCAELADIAKRIEELEA